MLARRVKHEYLLTANRFKQPEVINDKKAVAMLLLRLIILEPGMDPLHPDMGVGIKRWRYSMGTIKDLEKRIETQIETYLPQLPNAKVTVLQLPDHTCNVEIFSGDDRYIYESSTGPVPITLDDITN